MYARVIVDVPALETNRVFDYRVPPQLADFVEVGCRVGVPFGPRQLQGFVVDLCETTELGKSKLKDIGEVLDLAPPLTTELVGLARWMSRKYLCHELAALQVMLPGALKAKYERRIKLPERPDDDFGTEIMLEEERQIIAFVAEKKSATLDLLLRRFPGQGSAVKRLLQTGALLEEQVVKDRMEAKKVLTVFPPEPVTKLQEFMKELPANAVRQKETLAYLLEHRSPVQLQELIRTLAIGAQSVKTMADRGWIELKEVEVLRDPFAGRSFPRTDPLPLTEEQECIFQDIRNSLHNEKHDVFLLHGVTGSGKTEVYLQSIQMCLDQHREAIVLVPEISLTPQMVERFKGRFGSRVAVLHSRLSDGERYDEWRKIMRKQVSVVIGARSAVFAPFTRLGLIIIDEEHETSYKQDDSPKYHARDVAIMRGELNDAVVVLGSATPSLESYWLAGGDKQGSRTPDRSPFRMLSMPSRVNGRPLPAVHIIDMREELKEGNRSMFSRSLYKAIEERLHKKEQSVLLLNRRGYATFVMCRSCGYVVNCPHCDISLTYHQSSHLLRCHYCGYSEREAKQCPSCSSEHIRHFGTGTQRVEEELGKLFPGIRVIRMDVDTTMEKGSHEKWLTMFRNRQADVLLGTQMVAKGLDFPHVTLVGVIAADTVLNLPDFRSAEKTFQLLTQVAGRAGRHELPGEVYVQTYTPEHYSIQCAGRHDYGGFAGTELEVRKQRGYPPFQKLILITLSHELLPQLVRCGEQLAARLRELAGRRANDGDIEILGPIASPIPRIKDRYRFQCMVKYRGDPEIARMVELAMSDMQDRIKQDKLQISVDVDPQLLL